MYRSTLSRRRISHPARSLSFPLLPFPPRSHVATVSRLTTAKKQAIVQRGVVNREAARSRAPLEKAIIGNAHSRAYTTILLSARETNSRWALGDATMPRHICRWTRATSRSPIFGAILFLEHDQAASRRAATSRRATRSKTLGNKVETLPPPSSSSSSSSCKDKERRARVKCARPTRSHAQPRSGGVNARSA